MTSRVRPRPPAGIEAIEPERHGHAGRHRSDGRDQFHRRIDLPRRWDRAAPALERDRPTHQERNVDLRRRDRRGSRVAQPVGRVAGGGQRRTTRVRRSASTS